MAPICLAQPSSRNSSFPPCPVLLETESCEGPSTFNDTLSDTTIEDNADLIAKLVNVTMPTKEYMQLSIGAGERE